MIRGSMPTIIMELPAEIDVSDITAAVLSIGQGDTEIISKNLDVMTVSAEDNTLTVTLSQEDTLKLVHGIVAQIQLKVFTDTAVVSEIETVDVGLILNETVIGGGSE